MPSRHEGQGLGQLGQHGLSAASLRMALERFDAASRADPEFGLAHAHHALLSTTGANVGLLPDSVALRHATIARAERALELDPGNAVVLDPSNVQARVALGAGLGSGGQLDEAVRWMRSGMAISPRDRRLGFWSWALAGFLRAGGRRDEALAEARLSRQRDPRLFLSPLLEAVLLAESGQTGDATQALATARRLHPALDPDGVETATGPGTAALLAPLWSDTG